MRSQQKGYHGMSLMTPLSSGQVGVMQPIAKS